VNKVITTVEELDFSLNELQDMPAPHKVMVVNPSHFDVEYVINPHMKGHIGDINKKEAMSEWIRLKEAYANLGFYVHEVEGAEGYPDMVFCANQSLPNITESGTKQVVMSVMNAKQRKGEVPYIEEVYRDSSYEFVYLNEEEFKSFEGMGDALWHFKKRLIWGGYGYRTSKDVYELISDTFDTPVIALELVNEKFYHLDTCLCILNTETALIYAPAFKPEGLALIRALFPNVIEVNKHEAEELFACNATCPDGKNVFIQAGCTEANAAMEDLGFVIHEFNTEEYLKSGGSVFCMKMLLW
jgi:N-dimethylarginine dimethylaminohydrolase